jgi:hypothetical protein
MVFLDVTLQSRKEPKEEKLTEKLRYNWNYENNINYGKELIDLDSPQEFKYSQWRTNSSLSNFRENIFYVNEMNTNYHLSDKMHYHFLFHSIKKMKRYGKKKTQEEERKEKEAKKELEKIRLIQEYYKYNIIKAKTALKVLTDEQFELIKKKLTKAE